MDLASAHMANDTLAFLHQVRSQGTQPSLCRLIQAHQRFLGGFEEGGLRRRLGGNVLPCSQAKNPAESPRSSISNDPAPLQHHQGEAGHLRTRWILGYPPLGFDLPPMNNKINLYCIFFYFQPMN